MVPGPWLLLPEPLLAPGPVPLRGGDVFDTQL